MNSRNRTTTSTNKMLVVAMGNAVESLAKSTDEKLSALIDSLSQDREASLKSGDNKKIGNQLVAMGEAVESLAKSTDEKLSALIDSLSQDREIRLARSLKRTRSYTKLGKPKC